MNLFEPFRLPFGLTLPNRLVMAPMPTFAAADDGSVGDEEIAYYRRRAEGGVGVVITAGCCVAEDGLAFQGQWRCDRDRYVSSLERVAAAIQQAGAKAVLQLAHAGAVRNHGGKDSADSVVESFAQAAARARRAGFDGVEIHGGHRELLQQFLSPSSNPGSSNEREKVPLQVVAAIRQEGLESVWYRVDPREPDEDGLRLEDVRRFASKLDVDVLDLAAKRYTPTGWRVDAMTPTTMAVGGIEALAQAEQALADGCGLVGLGRLLLAHPDWPRLVQAGSWNALPGPPAALALRAALTPKPVIDYLVKKGKALS